MKQPEHEWNFLGKAVFAFGLIKPMGDGIIPKPPNQILLWHTENTLLKVLPIAGDAIPTGI